MDTFEAVRTVLAVRRYQHKPVPEEIIRRMLEAGRLTGSSMNLQPWCFITVQDRATLGKIGALVRSGSYTAQAALAIVIAIDKASQYSVSDSSRAVQSILLTAWSEGVGGNWVGFRGMESVHSLLGLPPEMEVLAVLPLGYPAQRTGRGKKQRKALSEVAHRERWGQSWE